MKDTLLKFIDAKEILLDSFLYPKYAFPEYLFKRQVQSGWSSNVFFAALREQCDTYLYLLTVEKKSGFRDNTIIFSEENEPYLDSLSAPLTELIGKAGKANELGKFSWIEWIINGFREGITNAQKLGAKKKKFSSVEIIATIEHSLKFIYNEFNEQKKLKPFLAEIDNRYHSQKKAGPGNEQYYLYDYGLLKDAPAFDFVTFKNNIRDLLLNSKNPNYLVAILKIIKETANKNVEIWNQDLYHLEKQEREQSKEENFIKVVREYKEISLNDETFSIAIHPFILERTKNVNKIYNNYKLAFFSKNILNFLIREVYQGDQKNETIKKVKKLQNPEDFSLFNLWRKENIDLYNKVINYLKEENPVHKRAWIKEDQNGFAWLGKITHARALAKTFRRHAFIDSKTSALTIIKAFNKTFYNLNVSEKSISEWSEEANVNSAHLEDFNDMPFK